ncbi:MAG: glycosyltransferase family 4 protein [Bacteroidales bacterium]|nr:glycosyltransferase family 4 protein [Bacteroidales bacterium]
MRIAFVTFEYPPRIEGGAGIYAASLTKELVKIGHEVHVLTPCSTGSVREEVIDGVYVHRVDVIDKPYLLALSFWINLREALNSLNRQLKGVDILHGNNLTNLLIFQKTIPQIVTIHSLSSLSITAEKPNVFKRLFDKGENNYFFKNLERSILNRSDIIIANSLYTEKAIYADEKLSVKEPKVFVIPNGPSMKIINPLQRDEEFAIREKLNLGDCPIILFVGRLVPRKGLHFLIQAMKNLNESGIRAKLIAVGDGSDRYNCINLVNELNLNDQVIFTGYIDENLLKKLYSLSNIVAIPSINEPFGIVALDAMLAGKPIVAFDSGALPEILEDNVNGMLVEPEDPIAFSEALSKYLSDPELAQKVGRRNSEVALSKYSWRKYAEELDRVYNFAITEHRDE